MAKRVDQQQIVQLRDGGMKHDDIATRLGCCVSTVEHVCRRLGLPRRSAGPQKPIDVALMYRMWTEGVPSQVIAERLGVCMSTLHALRQRHKLPKRAVVRRVTPKDPTPEELETRKAECRAKHFAQRRGESDETTLQWRSRNAQA